MTEKTQSTFAILSLLALSLGTGTAALAKPAGFALAREGKPVATIVVAKEATPAADLAAAELKYHIRKITGATLPIVTDETPVTGPRILVDESAATRSLGLRSDAFKPLERLVRSSKDTLVPGGMKQGVPFYANFCRIMRSPTQTLLTWTPNFDNNFHVLTRLGELRLE